MLENKNQYLQNPKYPNWSTNSSICCTSCFKCSSFPKVQRMTVKHSFHLRRIKYIKALQPKTFKCTWQNAPQFKKVLSLRKFNKHEVRVFKNVKCLSQRFSNCSQSIESKHRYPQIPIDSQSRKQSYRLSLVQYSVQFEILKNNCNVANTQYITFAIVKTWNVGT